MIRSQIREVRNRINLVARSVDSGLNNKQDELDILEMLRITNEVVESRLEAGIYTERQKDKKKKYIHLYRSIREEVVAAVRGSFTDTENQRASGLVLQKYNTLVLDSLFELLTSVGPENAIRVTKMVNRDARLDILNLPEMDEMDATIASQVLAKLSRARAHKNKPALTKAQRMAIIERAALNVELANHA